MRTGRNRTGRFPTTREEQPAKPSLDAEEETARVSFVFRRETTSVILYLSAPGLLSFYLASLSTVLDRDSFHTRPSFPPSFLLITRPLFRSEISPDHPFHPRSPLPSLSCLSLLLSLFLCFSFSSFVTSVCAHERT